MYRPTDYDMNPTETRQLSLAEAGKFDAKFQIYDDGKLVDRVRTCGWTSVCKHRQTTGISRKAQIRARKNAQQ